MEESIISAVVEKPKKGDISSKGPKGTAARVALARKLLQQEPGLTAVQLMKKVKAECGRGLDFYLARKVVTGAGKTKAQKKAEPSSLKFLLQALRQHGVRSAILADGTWTVTREVTETL